ncbi:HNH endonuclease [Phormidesmis priestleyi ULC007]|uniref:HNH endonuclease n=1 Tax=Phormidesmis priestleyi ULC007 TaxID=1920490 RepID=A0A2T1DL22_9CYAN|nr:HNH endonuclease signature motif containing protein [Phormidesmis priestleyi]PSB21189.1 HNH endonuclease [Phormidesmis priestleyi ULC007]PZO51284.1 MAG: HNH endonuclease [Phormidesmis priestleyi]
MSTIPTALRRSVVQEASNRCEYCRLSQAGQEATFHIDHIVPVVADGKTTADNLALACVSCSLHKSARQMAKDPVTGEPAHLFNPRQQIWKEHFQWDNVRVVGLTPTGRATVEALLMNRPIILSIRAEEELLGRLPPP